MREGLGIFTFITAFIYWNSQVGTNLIQDKKQQERKKEKKEEDNKNKQGIQLL
jgi:hypothetical protein